MCESQLIRTSLAAFCAACLFSLAAVAQTSPPRFRVIAFYTGKAETAHISFVDEANRWFPKMAAERGFCLRVHRRIGAS